MDVAEAQETLRKQFSKPVKGRETSKILEAIEALSPEEFEAVVDEIVQDQVVDRQTLTQYKWVADQFPEALRSRVSDEQSRLKFSHYRAVSGIEDKEQRITLLNDAAANRWSIRTLENQVAREQESVKQRSGPRRETPRGCAGPRCNNQVDPNPLKNIQIILPLKKPTKGKAGDKFEFCSVECARDYLDAVGAQKYNIMLNRAD